MCGIGLQVKLWSNMDIGIWPHLCETLKFELTWQEKASDFIITRSEWIIDPSTSHKKPPLVTVLGIWQRTETVWPQAKTIKVGSCDAWVTDKPCRCTECHKYTYKSQHKGANCTVASQAAFLHLYCSHLMLVFTVGMIYKLNIHSKFPLAIFNAKQ